MRDAEQTWIWAGPGCTVLYSLTPISKVRSYPVERMSRGTEADTEPFGEDKMINGVESGGEVE